MKRLLIVFLVILLTGCTVKYDIFYDLDPGFVLDAAGFDRDEYIKGFIEEFDTKDHFAKADSYMILARLRKDNVLYQKSCYHLTRYKAENKEEQAIVHESLSALNCNRKHNLIKAAETWKEIGVDWRADLLRGIAVENYSLEFDVSDIEPKLNLSEFDKIIIGETKLVIDKQDQVVIQTDRVFRDWLGLQMNQNPFKGELLITFSERLSYNQTQLQQSIGWHEGARMRDINKATGINPKSSTGIIVAKNGNTWYAPDEKGIFRFKVPKDKISYPTTRFLEKDVAVIMDTHGINMLVESAIRKNASVVIGCCDHEGKIKAAKYLSEKNISSLCFTDLYVYKALGHNTKILGSPTWKEENGKIIYGNSPITISKNQKIVVPKVIDGEYALWYHKTPLLYFEEINKTFPLDIITVEIDDFDQLTRIFRKATESKATIVGVKIANSIDYANAKKWLTEKPNHKIILFHSTTYPYGILLMKEFPSQISFDDPNPRGIR